MTLVTCPSCGSSEIFYVEETRNYHSLRFDPKHGLELSSMEDSYENDTDPIIWCDACGEECTWAELESHYEELLEQENAED